MLVDQERFAGVFDLRDGAFEVEGFGEDDFEDLGDVLAWQFLAGWKKGKEGRGGVLYFLHVDAMTSAAKDQTCSHCLSETSSL